MKFNKLGKILATAVAGVMIPIYAYASSNIFSQRSPVEIGIMLKDPQVDSEANTTYTKDILDLVGNSVDGLSKKLDVDNYIVPRIAKAGIETLAWGVVETTSHEYGHNRAAEEAGAENIQVEVSPFKGHCSYNLSNNSLENRLSIAAAGPNQDSLNALNSFRESQIRTSTYYQHMNKLLTRLGQASYISGSKAEEDDYFDIVKGLNEKGYNVSLKQMGTNNKISGLLSLNNLQSGINVLKFLFKNKREFEPFYFKAGENLEVGLPDAAHFFTSDGEYVEVSEFVKYKGQPIELRVLSDLDFTQAKAGVNTIGIGGKFYNIPVNENTSISPYIGIEFSRDGLNYKGAQIGTEIEWKKSDNVSFAGKVEYNDGKTLEASIKGKDGFYFSSGIKIKF